MGLKHNEDALEAEGARELSTPIPTPIAAPFEKRMKIAASTTLATSTPALSAKKHGRPSDKASS
ncbi:hypothetical protein LTR70_006991 [Exophiala xenobiotica]|nr:hypothetical protein LTR70_006991 [Exophiala xenobiotica]